VVAALAGVALGAGVAGQTAAGPGAGYRDAIEIVATGAAATQAVPVIGSLPTTSAEGDMAQLERPGYALPASTSAALSDMGASLSDVATLQHLQARILRPTGTMTDSAGGDLASLIRQAQMQAALSGAQSSLRAFDVADLQGAVAEAQAAQAALVAATKERDAALAAGTPGDPFTAAAATVPIDPAVRDAQARLTAAQQKLQTLEAGPDPALLAAAQKALTNVLAATPPAPTPAQMAEAQAEIDHAQQAIAAAMQGSNSAARTVPTASGGARAGAIAVHQSAGAVVAAPDPAASNASIGAGGGVVGEAAQQLVDSQNNLVNAKAALAALQQQAAYAANPESQPDLIAARRRLAQVQAPPEASVVAGAQAAVTAAQAELVQVESQVGSAGLGNAGLGGSTSAPASSGVGAGGGASGGDAVAAAERQLSQAQTRLRNLIMPSSDLQTDAAALAAASGLPPLGPGIVSSAANALPPLVTVAAEDGPLGIAASASPAFAQAAGGTLGVPDVALRAQYVADVAVLVEHLHPSALPQAADAAPSAAVAPASALVWPVTGAITQPFGVPELGVGSPHTGIDIGVNLGTPVHAAAAGLVSFAGGDPTSGYGYYVILDHGHGVATLYAHLALPPFLRLGAYLPQNGLVGLSGSTGFSTGPHVHFEVRLNGTPIDPQRVLPVLRSLPDTSKP